MSVTNDITADALEREILTVAHGRVGDLQISVTGNSIILKGSCPTFYCKKLIQDAVLRLTGEATLRNDMEVVYCGRPAADGNGRF